MTPQQPANYLDQSSGAYLRTQLEGLHNNGIYSHMVSEGHTKAWDTDQLQLQRKINALAPESNSGVDPESITGTHDFDHLTLQEIHDLVSQIKPEMVQAVSEAWTAIGKSLGDATTTLSGKLQGVLGGKWQGNAAASASDAIGTFTHTSTSIGTNASIVGMKVAFAQRGSDETYRMLSSVLESALALGTTPSSTVSPIPGVVLKPTVPGSVSSVVPTLGNVQSVASEQEESRQAAIGVLRNVYAPAMHGGDQGVPVLPSVQQSSGNPVAPVSVVPGSTNPVTSGNNTTQQHNSDNNTNQQNNNQNQNTQPSATQNSGNQSTTPASSTSSSANPNATTPASTSTAGLGSNAGLGSSAGTGGGLSYSGTGGGLGGSSSGSSRANNPGSSVPGKAAAAAAAANASRAATSTSSMSPGMMGGQGSRGKSEEDSEHQSSDLLRGNHLEEWIGEDQVLPAFGVIGGQVVSAQAPQDNSVKDQRPGQQRPPEPPRQEKVQGEYR